MANQPRSDREKYEGNGLGSDVNLRAAAQAMDKHPVLQGWLLLGLGAIIILFTFGFFPILKWALFASGIALSLWGVHKANLIETTANVINSIKKRF